MLDDKYSAIALVESLGFREEDADMVKFLLPWTTLQPLIQPDNVATELTMVFLVTTSDVLM